MELEQRPNKGLCADFEMMLESLLQDGIRSNDCVGLLPMYVHLAKLLDEYDELTELLKLIVAKSPALLAYIHEMLACHQLGYISGTLIERVISSTDAEFIAAYDFLVDIVEQRTLNPSEYGAIETVIVQNLKLLFVFLDHGRNRDNLRAWASMSENLQCLGSHAHECIQEMWAERSSWWKAFHSQLVPKEVRIARKKVLRVLTS